MIGANAPAGSDDWIGRITTVPSPGVVQAVDGEIIPAPLSPRREKHRLGLQQMGSPFTSIPTAQSMLETLFDLLEGI